MMEYGLDEVHDKIYAQQVEAMCYAHHVSRQRRKEIIRQIGYGTYDRFGHRLLRAWKQLRGKDVLSKKQWNAIVDAEIEKL